MAKTGRPHAITPEIAETICERLSNGETLTAICKDPAMPSFTTVWKKEQEDEQFAKLSARARELGTHSLADESIRIADDPDIDPQNKRIMVDTRLRLIGKWNARIYGDKTSVEHTGKDGGPIDLHDSAAAAKITALLESAARRKAEQSQGDDSG